MLSRLAIPRKRPGGLHGLREALGGLAGGDDAADRAEDVFAAEFARFVGAPHAAAVAGARAGLWALLGHVRAEHGVGEVVVSALTASIVPHVILAAGFDVRFVDCDARTFDADADALLAAVGPRTRVVIATHLEGFPVRVDRVVEALAGRRVLVVEDAAHALGAKVGDRLVGSVGDAAIFSLGKGKQLNALDGGIVTTRHAELAAALRAGRARARSPTSLSVLGKIGLAEAMRMATWPVGFDLALWPGIRAMARVGRDPLVEAFEDDRHPPGPEGPSSARRRLGTAQAVIGRRGLDAYPASLARRRSLAARYRAAAEAGGVRLQVPIAGTTPAPLELAVRVGDRARARAALARVDIDTQPTWMVSPATLPAFGERVARDVPVAVALEASLLYLPFYPDLLEREVRRVEDVLSRPPPELRG